MTLIEIISALKDQKLRKRESALIISERQIMENPITTHEIGLAMMRHGGSFVAALGSAICCADSINGGKLEEAFPEYFKQYAEWAKRDRSAS